MYQNVSKRKPKLTKYKQKVTKMQKIATIKLNVQLRAQVSYQKKNG